MKFDKWILIPIVGATAGFVGFIFGTNEWMKNVTVVCGTGNFLLLVGWIAFKVGRKRG